MTGWPDYLVFAALVTVSLVGLGYAVTYALTHPRLFVLAIVGAILTQILVERYVLTPDPLYGPTVAEPLRP